MQQDIRSVHYLMENLSGRVPQVILIMGASPFFFGHNYFVKCYYGIINITFI